MGRWHPIARATVAPSAPNRYAHGAEASHFVVGLVGKVDRTAGRKEEITEGRGSVDVLAIIRSPAWALS
jgi:hypothetical protein